MCVCACGLGRERKKTNSLARLSDGKWRCGSTNGFCQVPFFLLVRLGHCYRGLVIPDHCPQCIRLNGKDKVEMCNQVMGYTFFILPYLSYIQINRSIESLRHCNSALNTDFSLCLPFSLIFHPFFISLWINVLFQCFYAEYFSSHWSTQYTRTLILHSVDYYRERRRKKKHPATTMVSAFRWAIFLLYHRNGMGLTHDTIE